MKPVLHVVSWGAPIWVTAVTMLLPQWGVEVVTVDDPDAWEAADLLPREERAVKWRELWARRNARLKAAEALFIWVEPGVKLSLVELGLLLGLGTDKRRVFVYVSPQVVQRNKLRAACEALGATWFESDSNICMELGKALGS